MRIGFDVSQTGRAKTGCGHFAHSLARHLAEVDAHNEYLLYPTFGDFFWNADWAADTCPIDNPAFRRCVTHTDFESARAFWQAPPPDLEARLGWPDVVHANNFYCPTALRRARLVYTLYDLHFLDHPEWTTEANRFGCFRGVFRASCHADAIVAISRFTKDHFLRVFPHVPAERVVVAHLASRCTDRSPVPRPEALSHLRPDQFWLSVGTLEPRKNHRRLLGAYARLKAAQGKVLPLVLAGASGWLMGELPGLIEQGGLAGDVLLTGYVEDEALRWLSQNCFGFLYPSLWEGFGLPVLEAMSQGAAVITSDTTSLPEVAGDAALLVDPLDEVRIAGAMQRLATDEPLRTTLRQRAVAQAARFSWAATARTVLGAYQLACERPRFAAPPSSEGARFQRSQS